MARWITLTVLAALLLNVASSQDRKPRSADPFDLAAYDARIGAADRDHWAFQPIKRPLIPSVRNQRWLQNPIDAFILAGLEAEDMAPSPPAPRQVLLRRLYLNLTGLPPDIAAQQRGLDQPLEQIVDELLASPAYGERWGRHWLDLVRYAETNGYERDAARPHVWRYRDYVIRAFNDDKPYDRFILEQLAGDELPDSSGTTRIATGYYRLGPWDDEPADPAEDRFDQLDDLVNTTSQAFLGLTLACARCHDHKFEPLTMHDYYRMVAVFQPLQRPTRGRTELDLPAGSAQELALVAQRERGQALLTKTAILLGAAAPGLDAEAAALRLAVPDLPRGYFLHEPPLPPPDTHLLLRGKAARPGPKVGPGVPAVLTDAQPPFPPRGESTSLRRLTLAQWIASPANPLTARVIVNRVWQHHFGVGLVRTPSDFGVMGQAPTHPELLDWLASWFVDQGWSLKKLHRLILNSATYQQSSRPVPSGKNVDNRLFGRFPYRRLEAESIADSILAVSGQLNRQMYGPSIYPHIPKEALAGNSDPDKIWPTFDERAASRRAVYAFSKRSMLVPLFEVLDVCDSSRSCDRRLVTTVAPQALSLFNGDHVKRQMRHLAARLRHDVGPDHVRQIQHAFRLALCRQPTATEIEALLAFHEREAANWGPVDPERRALEQICRVIFNLNEFVYVD